ASYTIKNGKPEAKNPVVVGILIALSAFSLAESVHKPPVEKTNRTITHKEVEHERVSSAKREQGRFIPAALLGMTIASGSALQHQYRKKSRRRLQNGNLILGSISQQIQKGLSWRGRSTRTTMANRSKRRSL
ncbi:MAG: hypothetical protein F6K28_34300, partial [Microcoleus sp. SIO2G3]|nr:hypothetical protein [Microcoleus sp. SIO2G3]